MNKTIEEIIKENKRYARYENCGHDVVDEDKVIELVKQNYTPNTEVQKEREEAVREFVEGLMKTKMDDESFNNFDKDVAIYGLQGALNKKIEEYSEEKLTKYKEDQVKSVMDAGNPTYYISSPVTDKAKELINGEKLQTKGGETE